MVEGEAQRDQGSAGHRTLRGSLEADLRQMRIENNGVFVVEDEHAVEASTVGDNHH